MRSNLLFQTIFISASSTLLILPSVRQVSNVCPVSIYYLSINSVKMAFVWLPYYGVQCLFITCLLTVLRPMPFVWLPYYGPEYVDKLTVKAILPLPVLISCT